MNITENISAALQAGKMADVQALTQQALDEGLTAATILNEALLAGMSIIGEKFKAAEVFVPEVMVAARAMNAGLELLKPHLAADSMAASGVVVLGTVKGDLHDIGKNLVKIMMEGKGLKVIDLGVNVPVEKFIAAAEENKANVIACSSLLTTTMGEMQTVVETLKASALAGKVRVMVGGAPINQSFCAQIGADAYAETAADAADTAYELCKAG
ncbi:MAG: corrinoid protein [Lachnospiraceae bacterium]|jgi:corrinoid protein of di/trimethylamine methyltransferase|nr:corrinoid protein [Lachnospiraceae bacterium]